MMPAKTDIVKRLRRRNTRLTNEAADAIEDLRAQVRGKHSTKTKLGMMKARRANPFVRFGGPNPGNLAMKAHADAFAEQMRPVMQELAGMGARQAARELNARGIESALGGSWSGMTVARLRDRLASMG
jgi:hypothetical protein